MSGDRFDGIREEVMRLLPKDLSITSIEFEGPLVVIYTQDFDKFSENTNITKVLATNLRKRFEVRPDPKTLEATDEVEEKIRKLIPEEAEVTGLFFDYDTGVVTVEAINPGAIIGKGGQVLNDLKKETG